NSIADEVPDTSDVALAVEQEASPSFLSNILTPIFSSDVSSQANADNAAGSSSTEILIAGSTTVQPVSDLIAKEYMDANKGIKVTVQGGGSGAGIASAGMGIVDIGAASKFLSDDDTTKFPDLESHIIGGSAVVVIVNDEFNTASGVGNVTQAELKAIYDDNASTVASTIGGSALPSNLVVYQRQEASGTEETFAGFVTGGKDVDSQVTDGGYTLDNAIGNQGVLDAVKGDSNPAMGFVDFGFADGTSGVHMLTIDTYPAVSSSNVKAAVKDRLASAGSSTTYEYGLCRPLVYLTNGQPSSLVNNYIQYAMSPAALECFHDAGYFGITELQ
ncbi:MAG: phosphate transport system substrate-binding protein, partial [Methanolobus sp.]|nr:phosphate transport system substrate-binding protein [Methanolobus sp.]